MRQSRMGKRRVPGGGAAGVLDPGPYLAEVFEQGGVQQRGDPRDSPPVPAL